MSIGGEHPDSCRQSARELAHQGRLDAAESQYRHLLDMRPTDLEALLFVADRHASRGQSAQALAILTDARRAYPAEPQLTHRIGLAQLAADNLPVAAESLQETVQLAPGWFAARLYLAIALERMGEQQKALVAYFTAIQQAQAQGRWLSDETTAPALREAVKHAMRYVNSGRHQLFSQVLEPLRVRYGASALERVEQSLAMHLGLAPMAQPDPRQQPKFFYFAGVPSQPYYPRERFPYLDALEEATALVQRELAQVLGNQRDLEAFLGEHSAALTQQMLSASGDASAAWDAYFFHRHGDRYDEHCARCPGTVALLDAMPLVRIRDHAPEALFSVLRPGTHILPHRGVTNTRLVTHLPLVIPPDCALRVGGETHVWREGQCVTFDDTFEHEAWNRSNQTRVVLILDVWNPDLTDVERLAVTDLVEAIGDFNRQCEPPEPVA
ncbi:MAG TPA: aspartyl/asparaginyl beta-hydroxylase domain-containing protein [Frateuria sp.]|uniref:aspartyl/asparaginyl beta-hydroxylase domain-containing protein n=1 Tax=Frateuria sp. TaxID=2211372 RepID=UPI002D7F49A5|nr:aspartyl/asparaginyl beta-hydroxylase domain-containing protein [Frateuria sp.]HET6804839.1 aspartyl/asparaginyl beta-hydroxylase domain-containing protein [Frateuria sp.]